MTTVQIESYISSEQLLRAVEQLPPSELGSSIETVLVLRAQRTAPHLHVSETALLLQVNQALPADTQRHYEELIEKRETEAITPDELQELIQLTNIIEQQDAVRLAALSQLAQIRHKTLPNLMAELGIQAPTYD